MTTKHDRDRALAAVERIVNRGGGDVVAETLTVLREIYPDVQLSDRAFQVDDADDDDRRLLDRVAVLVSHFTRPNAKPFRRA